MSRFDVHTRKSAPERSVKLLDQAESAFGFMPNLPGVLADLSNYVNHIAKIPLDQAFHGSEWKPADQNVA